MAANRPLTFVLKYENIVKEGLIPRTHVVFFRDAEGRVPALEWLDELSDKAKVKCQAKLIRLREMGHELRRPEADYLRHGVYELRIGLSGMNYRILYFFHGSQTVVVSHGIIKERVVPPREIDNAIERKRLFESNPTRHTYVEE
jgi:phage-related protein